MTQDGKSAERERLAAALRANLRRRKATARPARRDEAVDRADEPTRPDAAAHGESKG